MAAKIKGIFRDPTSRTGWSIVAADGRYKDYSGSSSARRVISNPFASGKLRRSKAQRPSAPPKGGYKWAFTGSRWVQQKVPAKPAKTAKPKVIDPRDAQYQTDFGLAQHERQQALAEIEEERRQLPSLYNRGAADLATQLARSRYDSNAELAARGIFNSGERGKRAIDMQDSFQRGSTDLQQRYGSGRQAQLSQQLSGINEGYRLQQASLMQAAKDRYMQQNPASSYIWRQLQ